MDNEIVHVKLDGSCRNTSIKEVNGWLKTLFYS